MNNIDDLRQEHDQLTLQLPVARSGDAESKQKLVDAILVFCHKVEEAGADIGDDTVRSWLDALLREWSGWFYDIDPNKRYPQFRLKRYQPTLKKELYRHRYIFGLIFASLLLSLALISGSGVFSYFTRPVIKLTPSTGTVVCTPGEVSCLFEVSAKMQRTSPDMRIYLLGRSKKSPTPLWLKLNQGVIVSQGDSATVIEGQFGGWSSPNLPGDRMELVAVIFREKSNPLVTYPIGYGFDDYKSLPGLTGESQIITYDIQQPEISGFLKPHTQVKGVQVYGYENAYGALRIGYQSAALAQAEKNEPANFVRLFYNDLPSVFGIWGISSQGALDGKVNNALSFRMRNLGSDCDFQVKLKDTLDKNECCEAEVPVSRYVNGPTGEWTSVVVPLVDFQKEKPLFKPASIHFITFGFNEKSGACQVELGDIGLIHITQTQNDLSAPALTIDSPLSPASCLTSSSPAPQCLVSIHGAYRNIDPKKFILFTFSRTMDKQLGRIVSLGKLEQNGKWSAEISFPPGDILPGSGSEISAGVIEADSREGQWLLSRNQITAGDYEGLSLTAFTTGVPVQFENLLPRLFPQLANVRTAQLYAYSDVINPQSFIIQPSRSQTEKNLIDLHIHYAGQKTHEFAVWGVQNLNGFDISSYKSLNFELRGSGSLLVKMSGRTCENRGIPVQAAADWQTISVPLTRLAADGCILNLQQIEKVTFGVVGTKLSDIDISNVRFEK